MFGTAVAAHLDARCERNYNLEFQAQRVEKTLLMWSFYLKMFLALLHLMKMKTLIFLRRLGELHT